MSTSMHKNASTNVVTYLKKNRHAANGSIDHQSSQNITIDENISSGVSKAAIIDIEKQNSLSKIISLNSKGLNQEEIAQELFIDQSTVSRDLQYIKHEAKIKIKMYLREDILLNMLDTWQVLMK